jgi:hypothetical protein
MSENLAFTIVICTTVVCATLLFCVVCICDVAGHKPKNKPVEDEDE